jgi:hypothetical protein
LSENKPTRSGWYQFTLKSSLWVDNPSSSFKLINLTKEYRFFLDFCKLEYFADSSADQRALGNQTVIKYKLSYGGNHIDSPFKDVFEYGPACSEFIDIVKFVDWEYVVPDQSSSLTYQQVNSLK